jgi:hypothetical protein
MPTWASSPPADDESIVDSDHALGRHRQKLGALARLGVRGRAVEPHRALGRRDLNLERTQARIGGQCRLHRCGDGCVAHRAGDPIGSVGRTLRGTRCGAAQAVDAVLDGRLGRHHGGIKTGAQGSIVVVVGDQQGGDAGTDDC